jgi:putative zinc finger/helix-turn-helix YgiT family protein
MKCPECNSQIVVQRKEIYHYKECGIDRVYLNNVKVRVCKKCDAKFPRLPRIMQVHKTLGEAIALQPSPLSGLDIRLLRKQLGLRTYEWASMIGITPKTLSQWESSEQLIENKSDALIRLLYLQIREEREGEIISDPILNQLSVATNSENTTPPLVLIDANDPSHYSYQ